MLTYVEPNLPYTLRAQLRRDVEHARRCGFEMTGNLRLTDADGNSVSLAVVGGEWRELLEVMSDGDS